MNTIELIKFNTRLFFRVNELERTNQVHYETIFFKNEHEIHNQVLLLMKVSLSLVQFSFLQQIKKPASQLAHHSIVQYLIGQLSQFTSFFRKSIS